MTVHRYDGDAWLTKLERIGRLAKTKPSTVFNNIGHAVDLHMLRECYQQLDGKKAAGIDKITKAAYGKKLGVNLENLLVKIRRGTYKPQPSKIVEIPKEDGSTRPLAIACFEDKLVQFAASKILNAIYEPIFLPCSFGFRENRSCHTALRELSDQVFKNHRGAIVEIDIRKYFNTIPHKVLDEFLKLKITDRRFLGLIHTLMTSPIIEDGYNAPNAIGCPQGSIISPVLANIYLHYVIDSWFETISETHIGGRAKQVRYADDMVFTFQVEAEAKKFFEVLPKRLKKYGLEMHMGKSQLIKSGKIQAQIAHKQGIRIPTYQFLGFTCYWGKAKSGKFWRLKYTSRRDRFNAKLKGLRDFLWKNLNTPNITKLLKRVLRVIKGWVNYHGISDNDRRVHSFLVNCKRILFKWFNRRGGKKYVRWDKFIEIITTIGFSEKWKTISMFPKPTK